MEAQQKKVSVGMSKELYDKIREEAARSGRTVANWIREIAIKNALKEGEDNG